MNARLHKLARGAEIPNNCDILAFLESYEQTEQTLAAVKDFIDASRALTSLYRWKEFKTATGTSNVEKHCVRCHATFTDDTNHQRSCVLPHWFESDGKFTGQYLSEDVRVYSYRGRCCRDLYLREVAREGRPDTYYLNLDQIKPHFEGRHTQDIFEADYNRMNVAVCTFDGSKKCISTPVMYVGDEAVMVP